MRGLVVGRFQPLHNGHFKVLRQALLECDQVAVAIGSTNAKPSSRNPFSFDERRQFLTSAFAAELQAGRLSIHDVPDIHDADRWVAHCLGITGKVDQAYGNDELTLELFERAGLRVVRTGLWDRAQLQASAIRVLLAEDDVAWRKAVPGPVADLLTAWRATERLQRLE